MQLKTLHYGTWEGPIVWVQVVTEWLSQNLIVVTLADEDTNQLPP